MVRKPRKTWKIIVLVIVLLILGIGAWIGITAYKALKNITADSGKKPGIFNFLGDLDTSQLKGESEGRTNILLLGIGGKNHPGAYLSDTMLIVSINWQTKKIALISLPRDLWVEIPGRGWAKINEAYAYGQDNQKTTGGGGKEAETTVNKILGIPIHYYVSEDFEGFKKIVDTLGGLDINVDKSIYDPYYPDERMIGYDPFSISVGMHHMDGNLALKYARSRKTTSDFDRSRRQEQVLSAIKDKALSLNILTNPKKITDLLNILGDHLRTDLSLQEMKKLANSIKSLDSENIISKVFEVSPGGPLVSTQDSRGYIIYPRNGMNDYSEIQAIAKNIFSEESQSQEANIEVLNGAGESGVANSVAQFLKAYGYNIIHIGDSKYSSKETIVYNCSGSDFSDIAKDLADKLKAQVKYKSYCPSINNQEVNIQIIVGQINIKN